jgi:hypothetical protein
MRSPPDTPAGFFDSGLGLPRNPAELANSQLFASAKAFSYLFIGLALLILVYRRQYTYAAV